MSSIRKSSKLTKSQIRQILLDAAPLFKSYFVDYRYLILSENFKENEFYIIETDTNNFLHLTGLITNLSASEFFNKCYDGSIQENDFVIDTANPDHERSVYSKMRRIKNISNIFLCSSYVEEEFSKGKYVRCKLATSDSICTIGFTKSKILHPMTLLDGFLLKKSPLIHIDLVLRGPNVEGKIMFDTLVDGDETILHNHLNSLRTYLDRNFLDSLNK